jgi:hypothetical protein
LTAALEKAGYDSLDAFEQAAHQALVLAEEEGKVQYETGCATLRTSLKDLRLVDVSGLTLAGWRRLVPAVRTLRAKGDIPDTAYLWLNDTSIVTYPDTAEGMAMKARAEAIGLTALPITRGQKAASCYGSGYLWTGTAALALVLGSDPRNSRHISDAICVQALIKLGLSGVTVRGNNYKVEGRKVAAWGGIGSPVNDATCNVIAITYNLDFNLGSAVFARDLSAAVYSFGGSKRANDVRTSILGAFNDVLGNPRILNDALNAAETAVI